MDGESQTGDPRDKDDEKLLWRANLYIDEGPNDWNELNPWNAHPTIDDGIKIPFKLAGKEYPTGVDGYCFYGRNEWNREQDGVTPFIGIGALTRGDGGQVILIADYTPMVPVGGVGTNDNIVGLGKAYSPRVAYSYPFHPFEEIIPAAQTQITRYERYSFDEATWTTQASFNDIILNTAGSL
jgi:hypothetical protein